MFCLLLLWCGEFAFSSSEPGLTRAYPKEGTGTTPRPSATLASPAAPPMPQSAPPPSITITLQYSYCENATSEDSQQGWCVWGVSAWFGNGGGCAGVREEGWGGESRWAVRSGGVLAVRRRYPPGPTGASFFQPPLRILFPPRLFREVCCHRPRRRPSRHPRRRSSRRRCQIDR